MAGSPVIELILGSLVKKRDGTFDLPKAKADKLSKALVARARLPSARTEVDDAIRFAAFLGKDKKSPAAAIALAAAVTPMVKALREAQPRPKPSAAPPKPQLPFFPEKATTAAAPKPKPSVPSAKPRPSAPAKHASAAAKKR